MAQRPPSKRRFQKRCKPAAQRAPDMSLAKTVDLTIEGLNKRGEGIAHDEGAEVSIAYTAPGDKVTARVAGDRGWLETLHEPGPARDHPVCELYGDCGGCSLQHLSADFQRQWKEDFVRDCLSAEGVAVPQITPSPVFRANSRRRATLSVDRSGAQPVIGFKARRTHKIIPMTECHILLPSLFSAVRALPEIFQALPKNWISFSIRLTACDNGIDVDLMGAGPINDIHAKRMERLSALLNKHAVTRLSIDGEPLLFTQTPIVRFDDIGVELPPGGFLQASREGQAALLTAVSAGLAGFGLKANAKIADLFSGCGAFSLPLARKWQVFAVDNDAAGIAALTRTARATSGLKPVTTEVRDLFRQPLMADEINRFDALVLDPPRAGAPAQVKAINESTLAHFISVSCNPASFARDARILGKGGYTLQSISLIDQFAFTPHVELVGVFERK